MWQTPKTNWKAADTFNIGDYNRIIGNIAELRTMAIKLYKEFTISDMGPGKTYGDYIYADEINAIEGNLTKICGSTYPFPIGEQKTYYPNQPAADYKEINRIESACRMIHDNLAGQAAGKRRLACTLGGERF